MILIKHGGFRGVIYICISQLTSHLTTEFQSPCYVISSHSFLDLLKRQKERDSWKCPFLRERGSRKLPCLCVWERERSRRSSRKLWKGMAWTWRVERIHIHTSHYLLSLSPTSMLPFCIASLDRPQLSLYNQELLARPLPCRPLFIVERKHYGCYMKTPHAGVGRRSSREESSHNAIYRSRQHGVSMTFFFLKYTRASRIFVLIWKYKRGRSRPEWYLQRLHFGYDIHGIHWDQPKPRAGLWLHGRRPASCPTSHRPGCWE